MIVAKDFDRGITKRNRARAGLFAVLTAALLVGAKGLAAVWAVPKAIFRRAGLLLYSLGNRGGSEDATGIDPAESERYIGELFGVVHGLRVELEKAHSELERARASHRKLAQELGQRRHPTSLIHQAIHQLRETRCA